MMCALAATFVLAPQWRRPTEPQQLALYRYALQHTAAQRQPFRLTNIDSNLSDALFHKLLKLDPKLHRGYEEGQPSLSIGDPIRVETGALYCPAHLSTEVDKTVDLNLFLALKRGRWSVHEAPAYPAPPELLAVAVAGVLGDDRKSHLYVDADEPVITLLRRKYPDLEQRQENHATLNSQDNMPAPHTWVIGIHTVWLNRSSARVYMSTLAQVSKGDVTYMYGGPIYVWKRSRIWKAKRLDTEWTGE